MKKGFTLIELLVVISLIGILTTLVMANLNAGRARSRDAQRISDLKSISTALRLYYNDRNAYPATNASNEIVACTSYVTPAACVWGEVWSVGTSVYMPVLPADPLPNQTYLYEPNASEDTFVISACLENESNDKGTVTANTTWCPSGWMYQLTI